MKARKERQGNRKQKRRKKMAGSVFTWPPLLLLLINTCSADAQERCLPSVTSTAHQQTEFQIPSDGRLSLYHTTEQPDAIWVHLDLKDLRTNTNFTDVIFSAIMNADEMRRIDFRFEQNTRTVMEAQGLRGFMSKVYENSKLLRFSVQSNKRVTWTSCPLGVEPVDHRPAEGVCGTGVRTEGYTVTFPASPAGRLILWYWQQENQASLRLRLTMRSLNLPYGYSYPFTSYTSHADVNETLKIDFIFAENTKKTTVRGRGVPHHAVYEDLKLEYVEVGSDVAVIWVNCSADGARPAFPTLPTTQLQSSQPRIPTTTPHKPSATTPLPKPPPPAPTTAPRPSENPKTPASTSYPRGDKGTGDELSTGGLATASEEQGKEEEGHKLRPEEVELLVLSIVGVLLVTLLVLAARTMIRYRGRWIAAVKAQSSGANADRGVGNRVNENRGKGDVAYDNPADHVYEEWNPNYATQQQGMNRYDSENSLYEPGPAIM